MKKTNGNCKAVRCLTNGKYYHSVKEAAEANGVACSSMSYAISHKTQCKGKKFGFEFDMEKNIIEMASNLSEMEITREEMAEFYAWKAEKVAEEKRLEAERKAKEEREQKIAKLEAKITRYDELIDRTEQRKQRLISEMASVAFELKALRETEV